MKTSKRWALLLALAALLCLGAIALLALTARPGTVAQVYQDGTLTAVLPLDEDASLTLTAPNGGSNTVEVADGRVRVSHATCPDLVCVRQGWTDSSAVPIVCLPNQLVIQIKGGEGTLDAATQ